MYLFFANKPKADAFLKKYRLLNFCDLNYEYPIDFLEESLPEQDKDEYYYYLGRFQSELDNIQSGKKGKRKK